jgi:hypothetical protein
VRDNVSIVVKLISLEILIQECNKSQKRFINLANASYTSIDVNGSALSFFLRFEPGRYSEELKFLLISAANFYYIIIFFDVQIFVILNRILHIKEILNKIIYPSIQLTFSQ